METEWPHSTGELDGISAEVRPRRLLAIFLNPFPIELWLSMLQ